MLNELSLFNVQCCIDLPNGCYSAEISILSVRSWGKELHRSNRLTEHIILLFWSWTLPVTLQLLGIYPVSSADSWLREVKRGNAANLYLIKCGESVTKPINCLFSLQICLCWYQRMSAKVNHRATVIQSLLTRHILQTTLNIYPKMLKKTDWACGNSWGFFSCDGLLGV